MDSLSSGLVADVLERLHREADAADAPLAQAVTNEANSREEMISQVIAAENRDLEGVYRGFAGNFLSISPRFGRFLYMCAHACKAKHIVEFGSSMGISAIYMAAALRDMGGGRLIGTDIEPGKIERARANLAAAGLADLVEFRLGDARETLSSGLRGDIDMVMLDGAFTLYLSVLKLLEPQLLARRAHRRRERLRGSFRLHRLRPRSPERLPHAITAVRSRPWQRAQRQDEVIRSPAHFQ